MPGIIFLLKKSKLSYLRGKGEKDAEIFGSFVHSCVSAYLLKFFFNATTLFYDAR